MLQKPFHYLFYTMDPIDIMNTVFTILHSFGFRDPGELLEVMKETNMYISGSVGPLALHPNSFIPNNIDFYASSDSGQHFVDYINYLDFTSLPSIAPAYLKEDIDKILCFRRFTVAHCVNIILVHTSHPLQLLPKFHSTLVMNFIAWYRVVTLYPTLTMNNIGFSNIVSSDNWRHFEKYRMRGFEIKHDFLQIQTRKKTHICASHPHCPQTIRYLHDGHSLIHHFPQLLEHNKMGFFNERCLAWKLYGGECNERSIADKLDGFTIQSGFSIDNNLTSSKLI